jgi:hypothetical protein
MTEEAAALAVRRGERTPSIMTYLDTIKIIESELE